MDLQLQSTVSRFVAVNRNDTNVVGNLLMLLIVYLLEITTYLYVFTYMAIYEDVSQRAQLLKWRVNCIWMFKYQL